jgi:succinoglycan biosynthesis protein ExoM
MMKLVICTITRKRQELLRALLVSWARQKIPSEVCVQFLVVENNDTSDCRSIVLDSHLAKNFRVAYVLEEQLGIPFARNRAAREAIKAQADFLAFVDDDEEVTENWLYNLVAAQRLTGALIVGGPVLVNLAGSLEQPGLTWFKKILLNGLVTRYQRKAEKAARRCARESAGEIAIVTNNWLASISIFTELNIYFDESMRFTGGTDTKWFHKAKSKGVSSVWAPDAIVLETIPVNRLSLRYQFRRGRDQSINNYNRQRRKGRLARAASLLTSSVLKSITLALSVALLPLTAGRSIVDIARIAGWITGRVYATIGIGSTLYR